MVYISLHIAPVSFPQNVHRSCSPAQIPDAFAKQDLVFSSPMQVLIQVTVVPRGAFFQKATGLPFIFLKALRFSSKKLLQYFRNVFKKKQT